jgi:hypothetical protein
VVLSVHASACPADSVLFDASVLVAVLTLNVAVIFRVWASRRAGRALLALGKSVDVAFPHVTDIIREASRAGVDGSNGDLALARDRLCGDVVRAAHGSINPFVTAHQNAAESSLASVGIVEFFVHWKIQLESCFRGL